MKKSILNLMLSILLALLVISACRGTVNAPQLKGTSWSLSSYGDVSNPTPAAAGVETNLGFESNTNLGGNVGCNSFGGDFTIKGNKIIFGPIMSTMMACEGQRMEQEQAVFNVFTGTGTITIENNKLTIVSEDGKNAVVFIRVNK